MSAATTSRRWVGRIAAASAVAAVGVGLASGVAVAAPQGRTTPAAAALPATQPGAVPAQVPIQEVDPDRYASARASWETRGRPHQMVIVRPDRIDVVVEGRLTRQVWNGAGPVAIADLDRALPGDWLTVTDGTVVLDATVVLVRDTVLEVGGPDGVRTLQLAGGATPAEAASLHTGGGEITLTGVTVTSLDPATGQPVAATAAGRPVIVASSGGRLELTDATISDLGTPAAGTDDGDAGVEYHTGATGSVVRTTFQRNSTGLELARSEDVHLDNITLSESTGDGLVLSGDRGTTMTGIRAVGNGENGVLVTGESSQRPVGGVTTSGNAEFGVAVVGQSGLRVSGVVTEADQGGGLRLSRSTNITVTDLTATNQRVGVFSHVGSSGIVLEGVNTSGGSRGLAIEKSTSGLEARNSTFTGARAAGISIDGTDIAVNGVKVSDSRSGVRVERGAHNIAISDLTVTGGRDGLVTAPATTAVVVSNLTVDGVESDAVRTFSPQGRITDARISGGTTGIDAAAATTITNTEITATEEGIHSRSPEPVYAAGVTVDTIELGINAAPGSPFLLTDSRVHALESIRGDVQIQGDNDLSLPPLNLLGAIGVPLIVLAILLEEVHTLRQRRLRNGAGQRRRPPLPMGAS
jgi:hypothetical protein